MKIFSDYPAPPGNKPIVIGEISGPSSYTQVTTGSPSTGGIPIKASDIGLVEIEFITTMMSDDGQYTLSFAPINTGRGSKSVVGIVIDANTGAEVTGATDLHLRSFRFMAVGR